MIQDLQFLEWVYDLIGIPFLIFLLPGSILMLGSDYLEERIISQLVSMSDNAESQVPEFRLYRIYQEHKKSTNVVLNIMRFSGLLLLGIFGYALAELFGFLAFVGSEIWMQKYKYRHFWIEERAKSLISKTQSNTTQFQNQITSETE